MLHTQQTHFGQAVIAAPAYARRNEPVVRGQPKCTRTHQPRRQTEELDQGNQAAQPDGLFARRNGVAINRDQHGIGPQNQAAPHFGDFRRNLEIRGLVVHESLQSDTRYSIV